MGLSPDKTIGARRGWQGNGISNIKPHQPREAHTGRMAPPHMRQDRRDARMMQRGQR